MKLNSILKAMFVTAVAVCFSLNADAQFKGILNKAKDNAKEVVKDKELAGSQDAEWDAKVFKLAKQLMPDCSRIIVYGNTRVVKPDVTATDYGYGRCGQLRNYSFRHG